LTFSYRRIMFSLILLLFLVSGAYGNLKIGVSTGDASGSSGYTESLGAKTNDRVLESTALFGSSLSQSFASSGSKAETFSVSNTAGDHADVGFDIINSASYSGSYTLSPKTAKYAQATEALDVNNADLIKTFANAYSRDGRAAEAITMITKGSLTGYTNSAYATSMKATVTQKARSASGFGDMSIGERAAIFDGNNLVVYAGDDSIIPPNMPPGATQLTAYSGSASALKDSVNKDLTIGSLSSTYISYGPVAWNVDANGNVLTSSDTGISITNGQISKYTEKATATRNSAQASMKIGSATGDAISSASNVVNLEGDNVNAKLDMGTGSLSGYSSTIGGYYNDATAKLTSATTKQGATSLSGDLIAYSEESKNSEGDYAVASSWFVSDYPTLVSVSGYGSLASAGSKSAATTQKFTTASGISEFWEGPFAQNNEADIASGEVRSNGNSIYGNTAMTISIRGYSDAAMTTLKKASVSQSFNSASGNRIAAGLAGWDPSGDSAGQTLNLEEGSISRFSGTAYTTFNTASTSLGISSAKGSSIDVHSDATTIMPSYVGLYDQNGNPIQFGGQAEFRVQANSLANTKIATTGTTNNVKIAPTLQTKIKTALILEPFQAYAASQGATDSGSTAFSDLVAKNYATLRYTDSGASRDKYANLGKYDVVVAVGHMAADKIYLSTAPEQADYISASQLKYKTSKKALVVLNGCNSFAEYPKKSPLANAVARAYLSGGFAYDVDICWSADYLAYFFDALKDGNTAYYADSFAHQKVQLIYGTDSIPLEYVPMKYYPESGKQYDFKL
jgi:hypothetical protein